MDAVQLGVTLENRVKHKLDSHVSGAEFNIFDEGQLVYDTKRQQIGLPITPGFRGWVTTTTSRSAPPLGTRFGKWFVVSYTPDNKAYHVVVQCSCGSEPRLLTRHSLIQGKTSGCKPCAGATLSREKAELARLRLPAIGARFGENVIIDYLPDNPYSVIV
ncbi:hypothetical protein [Pseudomonas fluorescens]|uniref:hypothetical protein n=1 Tax=Pseudomonas fluorescens TaxID=294 RepID=UPI00124290B7|nr:hypothetical protein [Pseudomonas fluorescens]VVM49332.1 hypothetical protein PS639_00705 [Pseudomonas fluorescens]